MKSSANLVVMGKTGAGKSTLINAIFGEEVAATGVGAAITKEVKMYSKEIFFPVPISESTSKTLRFFAKFRKVGWKLKLYDTVGLEIDHDITQKTLEDIRVILNNTKFDSKKNDVTLVMFCINADSNRFEQYEAELIKDLSIEYEIPFVIVLTQCFSDERGELEQQIEKDLPEITTIRILAKDYRTRGGTIPAFGVDDLLRNSIMEYSKKKIYVLQAKLDQLIHQVDELNRLHQKGKQIVEKYSNSAAKAGAFSLIGFPFIKGIYVQMINELNQLYNVKIPKEENLWATIDGILAMPLMAIPILGSLKARDHINNLGSRYLDALYSAARESSSDLEISRVRDELLKQQRMEK